MAYFDYNATTPLNSAGREALLEALENAWANPSSPYADSARVHNSLEAAREDLAALLDIEPDGLIFTSGATEANNAVVRYFARLLPAGKMIALSPFEHPSVDEPARFYLKDKIRFLNSDPAGLVDLDDLQKVLKEGKVGAVSVMAVNNESGVIQPWEEVAKLCRESGVFFHCDASQWFGKAEGGDFSRCDFLVGCGHKFGAPKGSGFLAASSRAQGIRLQLGGAQESGQRGGTENTPAILGMVAALKYALRHFDGMAGQKLFRDKFETAVEAGIPKVAILGKNAPRVPNTSYLLMPRFENLRWVRKLDLKGFQISTGAACSTGKTGQSALLTAMGFPADAARRTLRISSGPETTNLDWQELAEAFKSIWVSFQEADTSDDAEVISI
ncbi:MAG: cysteine desulfurase [Verrucomicrobiae bacterium]|nr:cysteine desulfurase [Verrucomicrobiae bacterium]